MTQPFRAESPLRPEQVKTYAILRKDGVHFRPATCAEVECEQWRNGWITRVPAGSDMDQYLLGRTHDRKFFDQPRTEGGERTYTFPPGQPCFRASEHRIPIEREPFYVVREGDWRGNPRGVAPVQRTADNWVDDFANHQARIADAQQGG